MKTINAVIARNITSENLVALVHGEIDAIHCRGFCPKAEASIISRWAIAQELVDYKHDRIINGVVKPTHYGVGRIGPASHMASGTPPDSEEWKEFAAEMEAFLPRRLELLTLTGKEDTPIEHLRLMLELCSEYSADVAPFPGARCSACGIFRVTYPNMKVLEQAPHVDKPRADLVALGYHRWLSANIYFDSRSQGGELLIYPGAPSFTGSMLESEGEYARKVLAEIEPFSIDPKAGDLVLIDPTRLHAVRAFPGTDKSDSRASQQAFVAYKPKSPFLFVN